MKNKFTVDHLCYSASAQTAAYRLHKSLCESNYSSRLLVGAKSIEANGVIQPVSITEKISAATGVLRELFFKGVVGHNNKPYFSINLGPEIFQKTWLDKISNSSSGIIHLHWVGNGFLPLNRMARINKPIVWTMHDVWPFTGGCHVNGSCEGYKSGCESCPQLGGTRAKKLASKLIAKKKSIYKKLNINVIAPSSWMESKVRESMMFDDQKIHRIPNALDTQMFKPHDKKLARLALGLNLDSQIIVFGAISALSDPNKGYDLLAKAIRKVSSELENLQVVVFGAEEEPARKNELGCEVKFVGRLADDVSLSLVYSAADVVVVASRQESYSQVTAESISCGTPVVAFNSTGPRDIIDHEVSGYLAKPYDTNDLARGIMWILEDPKRGQELSRQARSKALNFCSYSVVAKKHVELYCRVLNESKT